MTGDTFFNPHDAPTSQAVRQNGDHRFTRRRFLMTGAGGIAGASLATGSCRSTSGTTVAPPLAGVRSATPADLQNLVGDGRKRRILLRGAVVLTRGRYKLNNVASQAGCPPGIHLDRPCGCASAARSFRPHLPLFVEERWFC